MATTQYIGARYVPLFADPAEWSSTKQYEPLTIVIHEGNSYTSKQYVPVGIDITNEKFWALTGNYNAQVEAYRKEVRAILPLDNTPTDGSTKGVTSDGIKKAIDASAKVNADAIAAETARAKAAEQANSTAIAAETARAEAAEQANSTAISNEINRATNTDNMLSAKLNDISGIRYYANVSDMKSDSDIKNINNFKFAITENFYDTNDNGGSIYKIVDSAIADNKSVFAIQNNKYAVFISATKFINVDCFGAKKDNDTFDNAPIFNYMIDNFGFADFYGHYYVSTTIKVKNGCKLMSSKSDFVEQYGYINKTKFSKVNNIIYCDDNNNFEMNSINRKNCIYVENGSIENITVCNISATANHIYTPDFDGIYIKNNNFASISETCISGFNTGLDVDRATAFNGYKIYAGACIVCIKLVASDSSLDTFKCNTNVHMVPTINSNLQENYDTVYPAGLIVYGGNNYISNGKVEWTYYGLVDSLQGNTYNNIIFDWNYDSLVVPKFYNKWGISFINNCIFYSQNYHINLLATTGKLQVSNCGFFTSDGSAKPVFNGDNIKPNNSAFSIFPESDSTGENKCMFSMDNCDIAHSTTNTSEYWCLRFNPYIYASITNCYIGTKPALKNKRFYGANNYNIVQSDTIPTSNIS